MQKFPGFLRLLSIGLTLTGCDQGADLMSLSREARELPATAVDGSAEGLLVSVRGPLHAEGPLSDPGLLLPGGYVEIRRRVEMYAWHEEQLGRTAYRYDLRFDEEPLATVEFRQPEGHENPPVPLRSDVLCAPSAWVGAYRFQPCRAQLLLSEPLVLQPSLLERDDRRQQIRDGYLYLGSGTPESPRLGDVRISYAVVRAGQQASVLGEQRDGELVPAYGRNGARLYRVMR